MKKNKVKTVNKKNKVGFSLATNLAVSKATNMSIQSAMKEANRCLLCKDAPCSQSCPAGTDPRLFIRKIKFENILGAARTIRENNVFAGTCAYVCPTEKLCERACTMKKCEGPIDISGLQKFAVDYGKNHGLEKFEASDESQKGKVAIIGGGPGGLSAAYELLKSNFEVTVFDKNKKLGGVPRTLIPKYRLPESVIDDDIQKLMDLGLKVKKTDIFESKSTFHYEDYDSVLIATGLSEPYALPLFAKKSYRNIFQYTDFLFNGKSDKDFSKKLKNKTVVVIGGGSVAFDCASLSATFGAKKVHLIAVEDLLHFPADQYEMKRANELGVVLHPSSILTKFTASKGSVTAIEGCEVEFREQDGFNPAKAKQLKNTRFMLNPDFVVVAIGTKSSVQMKEIFKGLKLQDESKALIVANKKFATSVKGVFAVGDVVNGGKTVADAVGEGKEVARYIQDYVMNSKNAGENL